MDQVTTRLTFGGGLSARDRRTLAAAMNADTRTAEGWTTVRGRREGALHTSEAMFSRSIGGAARRRAAGEFEMVAHDLGFRRTVLALRSLGLPYRLEGKHMLPPYEDRRHDLLHADWKPVAMSDGTSSWRKADCFHCWTAETPAASGRRVDVPPLQVEPRRQPDRSHDPVGADEI